MKKHYTDDEIGPALNNLEAVLKELNITEYSNNLYTEYDPIEFGSAKNKSDYILLESTIKDTSYKLLDAIKELINVLFEWNYKLEARFQVSVGSELCIVFNEPIVKYQVDMYNCKKFR